MVVALLVANRDAEQNKKAQGFWRILERLKNVILPFYVIRDHVADDVGGLTPLR